METPVLRCKMRVLEVNQSISSEGNINNPSAHGVLSKGHEFYVDFTPAEKSA